MKLSSMRSLIFISITCLFILSGLIINDLLLLAFTMLVLIVLHVILGNQSKWQRSFMMTVYISIPLFLINILLISHGQKIVCTYSIPVIELTRIITFESIVFSLSAFQKLSIILLSFSFGSLLISRDEFFIATAKFLPRTGLILMLTATFVSEFQRRYSEAYQALIVKGLLPNTTKFKARFQTLGLLWKPVFRTSLEDAWSTAEALHAKAYGCSNG